MLTLFNVSSSYKVHVPLIDIAFKNDRCDNFVLTYKL